MPEITSAAKRNPKPIAIGAELLPDESQRKAKPFLSPLVLGVAALAVLVVGVAVGTFIAFSVVRGQAKREALQEQTDAALARADKLIAENDALLSRVKLLDEKLPTIVEEAKKALPSEVMPFVGGLDKMDFLYFKGAKIDDEKAAGVIQKLNQIDFFDDADLEAGKIVVDGTAWDRLSKIENGRAYIAFHVKLYVSRYREVTLFNGATGQSVAWVQKDGKVSIFR